MPCSIARPRFAYRSLLVAALLGTSFRYSPSGTASEAVALLSRRISRSTIPREQPDRLVLGPGTTALTETLRIGPEHSGTPGSPTIIEGRPGGGSRLTGSVRLLGWVRQPGPPGLWSLEPETAALGNRGTRQLFVDGVRWRRARTPDSGFLRANGRLRGANPVELPFHAGDARASWKSSGAELVALMKWTDLHVPVLAVDEAAGVIRFPGSKLPDWMDEPDARYWIENTADALNQPGEWRWDPAEGRFWLRGTADFDPNRANVTAARLTTLVRIEGTAANPVHDVALRNLVFSESDYEMPGSGRISPQAAVEVEGALSAVYAHRISVEQSTFSNLGGYGLGIGVGCRNWSVRANGFQELGAGGIRVGTTSFPAEDAAESGPVSAESCHSHRIEDNDLHALGRVFPPACGILVFHSASNHIAHNRLHDLFYTAISVGWNWGYSPSPCHHNVIEFNHAHDIGQGLLSDMGGIYTLGPQPGTIVRNNLFHDIRSHRYGGWALYTDEGSTGIVVEDNVVYRCTDAGFHQHYGRDNRVRNNLIVDNVNHSVMRTRSEAHRSFVFELNVVVGDGRKWLGSDWSGSTNQFLNRSNVWWDPAGVPESEVRFGKDTWEAWRARGQDAGSVIADPQLVDRAHPEKGLRPGSQAFALGFRPIDMSRVGPRTATGPR
jgi:parallel beta-helix repeat protein